MKMQNDPFAIGSGEAAVVPLVVTKVLRGDGKGDPYRQVIHVFTSVGTLVAENDPTPTFVRQMNKLESDLAAAIKRAEAAEAKLAEMAKDAPAPVNPADIIEGRKGRRFVRTGEVRLPKKDEWFEYPTNVASFAVFDFSEGELPILREIEPVGGKL